MTEWVARAALADSVCARVDVNHRNRTATVILWVLWDGEMIAAWPDGKHRPEVAMPSYSLANMAWVTATPGTAADIANRVLRELWAAYGAAEPVPTVRLLEQPA